MAELFVHLESIPNTGGAALVRVECEKVGSREAGIIDQQLFGRLASVTVGKPRVVVDLSCVVHLASMGIGTLVKLHQHCKGAGGRMAIFGMSKDLLSLLAITHLDKVFTIKADFGAAVKAVG